MPEDVWEGAALRLIKPDNKKRSTARRLRHVMQCSRFFLKLKKGGKEKGFRKSI